MFSYVSPPLAVTMYFLLIASTPLIGHLIFRLIIRALQLASYVYLITFCVLSFRLMAVPVVNITRKFLRVDVSSGYYICLLPNPYEKDWPVSLSCKYYHISYHYKLPWCDVYNSSVSNLLAWDLVETSIYPNTNMLGGLWLLLQIIKPI